MSAGRAVVYAVGAIGGQVAVGLHAAGHEALAAAGRALPSGDQEPAVRIPCPTLP